MTLIDALEELMGAVEENDARIEGHRKRGVETEIPIFEPEEYADTKGVWNNCEVLYRVLCQVRHGGITWAEFISEVGIGEGNK